MYALGKYREVLERALFSLSNGTIRAELIKTIKARIQTNDEQSRQLEDLYATWNEMLKYSARNHLSQLWRKVAEPMLYASLRKRFPQVYSYHVSAVRKIAKGKVRQVRTAIKDGDYKAKFQKKRGNDPVQPYYGQTYRVTEKDGNFYAKICYIPKSMIETKLLLTKRDEMLIKKALDDKYQLSGALLLKRGGGWLLYITIKKDATLPGWENCETIIGVDVGVRNLAYAIAYDVTKRKFHGERLSIKGGSYNHILRAYRRKLADIERRCGSGSERYRKVNGKYSRMRDEILHPVSKKVIQYAQKF